MNFEKHLKQFIRNFMKRLNSEYKFVASHFIFAILFTIIFVLAYTTFHSKKLTVMEVREKCIDDVKTFDQFYYKVAYNKDVKEVVFPSTIFIQENCKSMYEQKVKENEIELKNILKENIELNNKIKNLEDVNSRLNKVVNKNFASFDEAFKVCEEVATKCSNDKN